MRHWRAGALCSLLAIAVACANEAAPVGGPPDPVPPQLLEITPESGRTVQRPSQVEFRFDEVVAERPSGAPSLEALVMISPRDGDPRVRWRRNSITVRPRRGWRDSTTYVVTLLPGLADLRGNVRDSSSTTVFSTGGPIADTRIRGAAFDWAAGTPLSNALVMAITRPADARADSAIYITRTTGTGAFELPYVRRGTVTVYALNDQNNSYSVDTREMYDSVTVSLADSVRIEFYAFVRDSIGPQPQTVSVRDSVTIAVSLTRAVHPADTIDASRFTVWGPDSQSAPIVFAQRQATFDSAQAAAGIPAPAADSVPTQPDTLPAADTLAVAPADSIAAADSVEAPRFNRPVPASAVILRFGTPLAPETTYEVRSRALRNLLGVSADGVTRFTTPAPPEPTPPDSGSSLPAGRS